MFKVIELDIDPELSGDSRVTEIAWVEYPAIEQDMIYFGRYQFYVPPQYVADRACQAIKENEQRGNPAGTQVGKVRAQQLCQKKEVSLETIKRMKSYLERAKTYNTNNWDDNGTLAYGLWGGGGSGDDALTWVDAILSSIENQNQSKATKQEFAECPPATKSISINLKNRQKAIDVANYGPLNPNEPNDKYWEAKAKQFNTTIDEAKTALCQNCAFFNVSPRIEDCIAEGISDDPYDVIKAGQLGYCEAFDFKCASKRTCDAWVVGGPVKEEKFVYPSGGETKDEFISRCVPYVVAEGKSQDEALGKCYGMWEQGFQQEQFAPDKVSFDWDGTLTTERGIRTLENERRRGSIIYIISARNRPNRDMIDLSLDYDIPGSRIFTVGSNVAKVRKVEELGIQRHYDNNPEVRNELGSVGMNFDYDVSGLPDYASYPQTAMTESVLGFESCGCEKEQEFKIVGYMDGYPVFDNQEEAVKWGEEKGCEGYHTHTDDEGNEVYMGCALHSMMDNLEFALDEYSEEELEAYHALMKIRDEDYHTFQEFIYKIDGRTEMQVKGLNLRKATRFFRYQRKVETRWGGPDRPECTLIENKYFRRFEIDLMRNLALQYGHNRQPYSKYLWKYGPNCVHAWYKVMVQGDNIVGEGWAEGQAGRAMLKETANDGYYGPEEKRKSQIRYLIDNKDRFSKDIKLEGELEPIAYVDGYPVYEVLSLAIDASLALGCGGIYEDIIYDGQERFMACSTTALKAEKQKQLFAAVEEKRMIYTPLMIPRILIPRIDEFGEKYYVKFTEEAVLRAQRKYMLEGRLRNTNLEHSDQKFTDVVMVESWIVEGENDKAYQLGFTKEQIPVGTWMGGFTVLETPEGDDIWNNYVKPGKVRGASIEGSFILNFSKQNDPDYLLLNQIINILKSIDDERK
jgi:hypothetical protein